MVKSNYLFLHKLIIMQIFYAPEISGDNYILDEKESKHIVRVLRMAKGTVVRLIDGKGNLYEGIIDNADQKKCRIRVTGITRNFEGRDYYLHIGISPLKNAERFEWFVEKSVEIGVDEITPVICKNTEKPGIKPERIENLIISAMKQSLKANKTKLNKPCRFDEILNIDNQGTGMIAHCNELFKRQSISDVYSKNNSSLILIGPEGDFDKDEIALAIGKNFHSVHLGNSRLRTETAGIIACHSIYLLNQ
jgi:16S rRNA (uracil1498-N3)-methyltransferase